jgi:thiamine transporter ThiT
MNLVVYSAVYNGGYMLVEFVISLYVIYLLRASKVLNMYL